MELIIEVILALLQLFPELVLQIVFEVLAEIGFRRASEPFRRPVRPWLAALGYAIFGAIAGGLSLWLYPTLFIDTDRWRMLNLVLTPIAVGALMATVGVWRRRRGEALIRLDRFAYGYIFALAMALVRFVWGT